LTLHRAVCESNRTAVAQAKVVCNQAQTKALLVTIKDTIRMHDKCSSCWFMGMTHDHRLDDCTNGFASYSCSFRMFNIPKSHCWKCCLLQKFGVHNNISAENPCLNSDFMQALTATVWHSSTDQDVFIQHMKMSFTNMNAFGEWLMNMQGDWVNLIYLLLWAWDRRMAAGAPNKEPPQPHPDVSPIDEDQAVLIKLGFVVGDDLNCLSETDWLAAGALALQRNRILRAFQNNGAA
jgi:hypothetical protein